VRSGLTQGVRPAERHFVNIHVPSQGQISGQLPFLGSNKNSKKPALHSPKERKAAKQMKKHAGDAVPLLNKNA
jgi:hypothetical protein